MWIISGSFSRKAVQLIGIISQMMQAQLKTVRCSTTFCALGLFQPTGLVSCWHPACLCLPLAQLLLWQHGAGKKRRKSHGHHAWSLPRSFCVYITLNTTWMWIHSLTQHTLNSLEGCARTLETERKIHSPCPPDVHSPEGGQHTSHYLVWLFRGFVIAWHNTFMLLSPFPVSGSLLYL